LLIRCSREITAATSVAIALDTHGHVMPTQQAGAAEAAEHLLW
jgi:hypothetical protein